jgi:hypothetical protein
MWERFEVGHPSILSVSDRDEHHTAPSPFDEGEDSARRSRSQLSSRKGDFDGDVVRFAFEGNKTQRICVPSGGEIARCCGLTSFKAVGSIRPLTLNENMEQATDIQRSMEESRKGEVRTMIWVIVATVFVYVLAQGPLIYGSIAVHGRNGIARLWGFAPNQFWFLVFIFPLATFSTFAALRILVSHVEERFQRGFRFVGC